MTSPSMVQRAGDTLVIRSLVSGDQLFVNDGAEQNSDTDINDEPVTDDKDLPQCKIRRNYSCSNCNYFTQNPRHFLYHLRDVHQEKVKIFECPNCLYASKHFQKLLRHMKMVHGSNDNIELSDITKDKSKKKRQQQNDVSPSKKQRQDLNQFDDTMGKLSTELKCSLCPFTTRHQGQLTKHERQEHIKTKFFRCTKCTYVTHIKARFTKHVKYHSMPMIKCDLCDFRTPYKWNLDRHYKNHNGKGSFRCSACNFTADIKQSLTVHEMNHHVPPVGQAAGLGVNRRRNKVGASDATDAESDNQIDSPPVQIFPQTSTPKAGQETSKTHPKIKITPVKKQKPVVPQQNDRHNFQMDFIHTDDILQHPNGNIYIKKKCKYCTFKTAWDSEMVKHEQKIHNIGNNLSTISFPPLKAKRPIPNLIPIQNTTNHEPSHTVTNENEGKSPKIINLSEIKELSDKAGISSLNDFFSLFGEEDYENKNEHNLEASKDESAPLNLTAYSNNSPINLDPSSLELKRKHTSFFDKLKAKLMTNAGETCNLTCKWCGHESKCLSELAGHQKICGKEINITIPSKVFNASSTRCQYCRQRCKSSIDLLNHLQNCTSANQSPRDLSIDVKSESSETTKDDTSMDASQEPHPMENVVFVWNNFSKSSEIDENSQEKHVLEDSVSSENFDDVPIQKSQISPNSAKMPTHGTDLDQVTEGKRVFKCPHCTFWASTASRFHVHIVGHLNKKPFECSLCSYRSNWRWDITKHIRLKSVRDSAHTKAKVLMTDETGRRNYSKYNKYLTQMKANKLIGDKDKDTGSTQGHMLSDEVELPSLVPATVNVELKSSSQGNQLRPPPPLKPANNYMFNNMNEKKKNDDPKKTFKCKKCNFRDANRESILAHVKGHYEMDGGALELLEEPLEPLQLDDEVSPSGGDAPFRCGHCHQVSNWKHVIQRHCRLKHQGDVKVLVGGKNGIPEKIETEDQINDTDYYNTKHEEYYKCNACQYSCKHFEDIISHINNHHKKEVDDFKCCFCIFGTTQKFELYEHLKSHGVSEPEDYINKSINNFSLLENSNLYIKLYKCKTCPFTNENKQEFISHKQFHRPRSSTFKCKFCSYNTSKIQNLQQHLHIHGVDILTSNQQDIITETDNIDTSLVIDTHLLKDVPLVWVSKEGKFSKMYKCRFCPHVNQRKVNIQEHEKMHAEHEEFRNASKKNDDISYSCPDCSYVCNNAGVLSAHFKVHQGINGQIHCFVDTKKSDEEQTYELTNLLNNRSNFITIENDFDDIEMNDKYDNDEKVLFFCQECPARFLHQRDLETHMKFHGSRLFYRCEYCTYTARQKPHLLLHTNVHTESYMLETKKLQMDYPTNNTYPAPNIDIVDGALIGNDPVWSVIPEETVKNPFKMAAKKYACTKCPTKFYNNDLLAYHMTLHGGKHPYKCHICDYSAITRNNLEKHERIHAKEINNTEEVPENLSIRRSSQSKKESPKVKSLKNKKYKCLKCPCTFEKRDQFKIHLSLHGSKQRYQCEKCDYAVKYYANYVQHVKKHRKTYKSSSPNTSSDDKDIEPEKSPKFALKSLPTSNEPGILKLSVADRQTLMILQEIRNNASKDTILEDKKLFWCSYCPYTSYRKDAVDNHINRHICVTGIQNNYTCEHCDYTVPQSHFLREHTKIHFAPFKYHQPEGYMISKKMKLSYKIYKEDNNNEEQNENMIFEESDDYKHCVNVPSENDVTKIFINPVTLEVIENSASTSEESSIQTKEEIKLS